MQLLVTKNSLASGVLMEGLKQKCVCVMGNKGTFVHWLRQIESRKADSPLTYNAIIPCFGVGVQQRPHGGR